MIAITAVIPATGLRRFLLSPNSDEAMFHTENAGWLSESAAVALRT